MIPSCDSQGFATCEVCPRPVQDADPAPSRGRFRIDQTRYSCIERTLLNVAVDAVLATPLWLIVLAGQHAHTVTVTYPYAYVTYIVSPLAGLGGGISWRPPTYSLLRW